MGARSSPPTWRADPAVAVAVALAAAIAVAYLAVAPASADLAAQTYRSDLFGRVGFVLWDDAWYGGHPLPGYSVLVPPLGALLGPRLTGALAVVAAAGLFAALVRGARSDGVVVASAWFGAGVALQLLTGRIPFLVGVALGLAALLATQRRRYAVAALAALLTPLASPVAGAFLALAGIAWALGAPAHRRSGLALAACALVPVLVLALLFGEGGDEPFVAFAFWPALAALVALAALLRREQRVLRIGAALAAAACLASFLIPSPLGGNVTRLGALFAGPLVAGVLWPRRRVVLALAALPLAYWQLQPPVRDAAVAAGDPSVREGYYAPLLAELRARGGPPGRIEVAFTRNHWDATWVARVVPIARGWERQLDRLRNGLFYDGAPLTAARYVAWLHANAVRWVALPDAELDSSALAEAALLRGGVAGLRPVWRSAHWRLWAVERPTPLATGAARLTHLATDGFTLRATHRGRSLVRVHWSPYWALVEGAGCVRRAPGGLTLVDGGSPGTLRVEQRFSLVRGLVGATTRRCRGDGRLH